MRRVRLIGFLNAILVLLALESSAAEPPEFVPLGQSYTSEIRPLIKKYCHECHSAAVMEAEIDLSAFNVLVDIRKNPRVWQKVGEMLDSGQMPPKDAPQPNEGDRNRMMNWVRSYLKLEAKALAGDPGRVVLRRLNNFEYTNTIRDLTGVTTLQPAREFPVDSAAGEGFTNLGNALVMSPSLVTKYLDAAKDVAAHAVLLPDGFRFSPSVTRRDWTDELLTKIRTLYSQYTDARGATQVNLQGIVFDTNGGGRLPLDRYLEATLAEREAIQAGTKTFETIGRERNLSPKYLKLLWDSLNGKDPSFLLDGLRASWAASKPSDAVAIAVDVGRWQQALWRFTSVGHIGKVGGPKAWMESVSPLTTKSEFRLKLPAAAEKQQISLYLVALDAGDGNEQDDVIWQQPRFVAPGRPDLLLRDLRSVVHNLSQRRDQLLATTANCLNAADEAGSSQEKLDLAELAKRHNVDPEALAAWLDYLGVGIGGPVKIDSHFKTKISNSAGYAFISGWGSDATPLLLANSSDQHVRVPGNMKPHSVAVHPSPTLQAVVGWRSPVAGVMRVEAKVQHAHPECGNGVVWALELRRGATRQRLGSGIAHGAKEVVLPPIEKLLVQPEDVVSLLIGPRDGNHSCDLTAADLTLTASEGGKVWDLARDVSPDVQAANPHADRLGNDAVWHFYTEPITGAELKAIVPPNSFLAKWQTTDNKQEKQKLATEIQKLLTGEPPADKGGPDAQLHQQLVSLGGPLVRGLKLPAATEPGQKPAKDGTDWGLDPDLFGRHPTGEDVDQNSLCLKAPSVIEVKLPADLVQGWEFVASGTLHPKTGTEGTVQLQVVTTKPDSATGLVASSVSETNANSQWTDNKRQLNYSTPIVVSEGSESRKRVEAAFETYRNLFPAALCYSRIVPVDEVVTLTLFYREDHHFSRLMLSDKQAAQLDRLWSELHFVSQDALTLVDGLNQLIEFATQDADPKVFEPLRKPFGERANAFRQAMKDAEPAQLDLLLQFAARAYRRPLKTEEGAELRSLYAKLREQELPHDEAFRFTLARVLIAPAFLYRVEPLQVASTIPSTPNQNRNESKAIPVNDWSLASRLSYFLWSTMPDGELQTLAVQNQLHEPDQMVAQARRMLKDDRVRSLSTQFACQWLGVRDFDSHSEKSEQVFPTFAGLRGDMYEETARYFTDLFQRDGSVLEILNSDHTFLNEALAKHYGIPNVMGPEWRRVDGVKQYGRGGILTFATTLATQSGASRTSPILRGNWVLETLLGERLPRPPKNVPPLPESETDTELTVRQLTEKHRSVAACAHCHERIDAFGFSLESYDAIGRRRDKDLGGRPIDVNVELKDGTKFSGESGLQNYILTARRTSFLRHFCRKLLGYSLARGVQLSDEPLLDEIMDQLKANDYRFSAAIETIVRSKQFRYQQATVVE